MNNDMGVFVKGQVQAFKKAEETFENLRKILVAVLEQAAHDLPGVLIVQGRVKTIASFAEKCLRKRHKYQQPAWQLTDLCGVRVIVDCKEAVEPVRRFIEDHFEIDENEDTAERLMAMEFGYQSVHYIVSLKEEVAAIYQSTELVVPQQLFQRRDAREAKASGLPIGPVFKAEVQVRTLLQHSWAVIVHDNLYKTEMKEKPRHLVRESGRIAAQLEDADEAFVRLLQGIQDYRSYYGAYMTTGEIEQEMAVQEAILSQDPGNRNVALKLARLASTLDDASVAKRVEPILARFEELEDADIQRELGIVRWKTGNVAGRENLRKSTEVDPENPDNWCELGRTYFEEKEYWNALDAYQAAFRVAPEYPRALLRYVECRVLDRGDLSVIPLIRHDLERAIELSKQKIVAGVHLPWAWYDIGFFELLLGRPYQSLDAYGKGILTTSSPALVEAVYKSLTDIHKKIASTETKLGEHLNWVRSFLKVVLVGRYGRSAENLLCAAEPRLDGFSSLTICASPQNPEPFKPEDNIMIVAGACAAPSQRLISDYQPLIHFAFEGFRGTVCSGGTQAGISGVVGDLPDSEGVLVKIAYLPSGHPREDKEHASYRIIPTTKGSYSPLDPIMLWSDLLACGVEPGKVGVLGVSGGDLAAFEYRLGLLLGAMVGVLPDSGRAALEITLDSDWAAGCPGRLLRLPTDRESLRAYVQPTRPSVLLDPKTREDMAESTHESYRPWGLADLLKEHKELAEWKQLDKTFKQSNYDQVDHIDEKLKRIGLALRRVSGKPVVYEFNKDQIEKLAEMEHGRWVVERLLDGWTFGDVRDNRKKTRPQLISWADLPEKEKKKDWEFVRALPARLGEYGYEIYEPEKP